MDLPSHFKLNISFLYFLILNFTTVCIVRLLEIATTYISVLCLLLCHFMCYVYHLYFNFMNSFQYLVKPFG